MAQFRIAVGYRTAHRRSEPVILAAGFSPADLQSAIDQADDSFERFETGVFTFMRRGRKSLHKPIAQRAGGTPAASVPVASAEDSPAEELPTAGELDGPSLSGPPSRRRR
jgi:hypothetical protein